MNGNRWARLNQKVVFFACDAFISGRDGKSIAAEIKTRFNEPLLRTQVYKLIAEGRKRGYFQLTPPRDEMLSQRMTDRFVPLKRRGEVDKVVRVVSQGFEVSLEHVAIAGAETALGVIKDLYRRAPKDSRAVHVGFGAGATTMRVARYLAERLRSEVEPPVVVLHALSSGFNVARPATAPVAFFNFFHGIPGISYRGLFASAYVAADDWKKTRQHVGVKESFEEKDNLQVVITSLASAKDEDGELNRFMALNADIGVRTRQVLDAEERRVGDVMYRPFNEQGPITRETEIRAVTLFELDELVRFAADPNKAVILVAGPCGNPSCRRSRSDALMPLLQKPSLDVWSHLVIDDVTAVNCLEGKLPSTPGETRLD